MTYFLWDDLRLFHEDRDLLEEFFVRLRLRQFLDESFHGEHGRKLHEAAAKQGDSLVDERRQQTFFLAGSGLADVNGGINSAIREPAIEHELHIAGALKL